MDLGGKNPVPLPPGGLNVEGNLLGARLFFLGVVCCALQ